ncbi:MAG: copper uptake system-associated protein [Nitrobacter sp.]
MLWSLIGSAIAGADEDAVRDLLHSTFDKLDVKLVVAPVVATAGYAIADWTQGEMGGRALLRNRHGRWTIILCAGDGIGAEALRHVGIAPDVADELAEALAKAEGTVPAGCLAMFARFEGLLRMDEAGNHPPVHDRPH